MGVVKGRGMRGRQSGMGVTGMWQREWVSKRQGSYEVTLGSRVHVERACGRGRARERERERGPGSNVSVTGDGCKGMGGWKGTGRKNVRSYCRVNQGAGEGVVRPAAVL